MILINKDQQILLKDSKEFEGTIPICDWRNLFCTVRAFAKIIGVSPAMVIRLRKLGVITQIKDAGIIFLPSILDYCKNYLIPSELEKLLKRHGKTLEKILQAEKTSANRFSDPQKWRAKRIRIDLNFDVCINEKSAKFNEFIEKIKKIALEAINGQDPFAEAVKINFVFYRNCKRLAEKYGAYHELAKNITKAFEGIIYQREFQIVDVNILKFEDHQPRTEISIFELETNDF